MKLVSIISMAVLAMAATSSMVHAEVPQEHSHDSIVNAVRNTIGNNRGNLPDPIFGLLGDAAANKAAPDGNGKCLQQDTADQAITVAKQANDKKGIAAALKYRSLERNSGAVGQASLPCDKKPKNSELEGISQHQDPASDNADKVNKDVELALAKALAQLGEDPLEALDTATFPAGQKGDPTAKGKTCDDQHGGLNKADDCIVKNNLLTPIATADDIKNAVGGAGGAAQDQGNQNQDNQGQNQDNQGQNQNGNGKEVTPENDKDGNGRTDADDLVLAIGELQNDVQGIKDSIKAIQDAITQAGGDVNANAADAGAADANAGAADAGATDAAALQAGSQEGSTEVAVADSGDAGNSLQATNSLKKAAKKAKKGKKKAKKGKKKAKKGKKKGKKAKKGKKKAAKKVLRG